MGGGESGSNGIGGIVGGVVGVGVVIALLLVLIQRRVRTRHQTSCDDPYLCIILY